MFIYSICVHLCQSVANHASEETRDNGLELCPEFAMRGWEPTFPFPPVLCHTESMSEIVFEMTLEDYLEGEQRSEIRHEYIGGVAYAMVGGSEAHNLISLALASALRQDLRGGSCRAFMADVKISLRIAEEDIFNYPDVMVVCDPRDTDPHCKRYPKVVIEVLSESTERTDRREKFLSYTQIETLEEYVLAAQDKMEVTIFRRARRWEPEVVRLPEQAVRLNSVNFSVALREVYEGVK